MNEKQLQNSLAAPGQEHNFQEPWRKPFLCVRESNELQNACTVPSLLMEKFKKLVPCVGLLTKLASFKRSLLWKSLCMASMSCFPVTGQFNATLLPLCSNSTATTRMWSLSRKVSEDNRFAQSNSNQKCSWNHQTGIACTSAAVQLWLGDLHVSAEQP